MVNTRVFELGTQLSSRLQAMNWKSPDPKAIADAIGEFAQGMAQEMPKMAAARSERSSREGRSDRSHKAKWARTPQSGQTD